MWFALFLLAEVAMAPYMAPDAAFDTENGLLMRSQSADGGATLEYERPVVILPPTMVRGEIHTSQRRFVLRVDGEKKDVGVHYFEAELLGTESLPGYDDCVKIRRHALRMDYSGAQQGVDVTEWYALGVGLVRSEGERFWKDTDGQITRTEPVSLSVRDDDGRRER